MTYSIPQHIVSTGTHDTPTYCVLLDIRFSFDVGRSFFKEDQK